VYSASHLVTYNSSSKEGYSVTQIKKENVYTNPKGTFYVTANCSTGSKLYTFIDKKPNYTYHYNQPFTSTFGIIDFKKESGKVRLKIATYEVGTHKITDGPYIFEKTISSKSDECWSLKHGYPCCKQTTQVIQADEDGKWGLENNDWCGIPKESSNSKTNCWSLEYGYPCCKKTNEVVEETKIGK